MRIQKPTITSVTVLSGDGASLTGSFSGSFIGWEGIDGKPDPLLSSSAQIADDISGSLSNTAIAALGAGIVSGSSQLASDISGSFTLVSASIAADIAGLDGNYATDAELNAATSSLSASLAVDISTKADKTAVSGAFTTTSASIATDIATNLASINTLENKTLVSGSAQIASNISGSFVQASSSIASDIDTIQANISSNDTDISGLNTYTSSLKTAITVSGADTTILGNLTVQGTQTQLQTATLNVEDLNITVASGSATAAAANGAGLTVAGAGATLTYASTGDKWEVNKALNVPVNGIQINGTAVTATAAELNILDGADTDLNTLSVPANTTISTFGATLVDDADAATAIATLGLDADIATLSVPASTTISAYGKTLVDDADAATARTTLGLGGLATLSAVGASEITDNSVGAAELNVAGNGTSTQFLRSDGDGTFSWAVPTDTNTTYSAGTGISLAGTTFSNSGVTSIVAGTNISINQGTGAVTITNGVTNNNQLTNGAGYTTYTANQGLDNNDNVHFEGLMVGQTTGATANTIRCVGDIVAYYSSDAQFKDNVETLEGALDKVKAIRGVRFDWNDKQDVYEGHDIGVIAQEVEAVLPELVHYREHSDSKAVDYVKLTAVLIEAVKELSAKVDELSK